MSHTYKANPLAMALSVSAPVTAGLIQAATNGPPPSVTLDAAESAVDDVYNGWVVTITSGGAGIGQTRRILSYNGATKVAIIDKPWDVVPGVGLGYTLNMAIYDFWLEGTFASVVSGQEVTLADNAGVVTVNDWYNGLSIEIVAGPGSDAIGSPQRRQIKEFVGSSRFCAIDAPFNPAPTSASRYRVQGHLYHPLTELRVVHDGGTAFNLGFQPGEVAFGNTWLQIANETFVIDTALGHVAYLEFATAGVHRLFRFE